MSTVKILRGIQKKKLRALVLQSMHHLKFILLFLHSSQWLGRSLDLLTRAEELSPLFDKINQCALNTTCFCTMNLITIHRWPILLLAALSCNAHTSDSSVTRANNTRILSFLLYTWHTSCRTHVKLLTLSHAEASTNTAYFRQNWTYPTLSHVLTPAQNTDHSIHARSNSSHLAIRYLKTEWTDGNSLKWNTLSVAGSRQFRRTFQNASERENSLCF